jgi:hypothetical protein
MPSRDQLDPPALITNTAAPPMTPILFALAVAVAIGVIVFGLRRAGRMSSGSRAVDAGAVSTRWLSELRRDEPWTRS